MSNEYLETVMAKLRDNPTAQDIDFFIEAHARIGYLASVASGNAEYAEQARKFAEASAYADARANGAKSSADAERAAILATDNERNDEIRAREAAAKLRNLLNSVEQAINGIKFLSRNTDSPMNLPRS
jgi:hypothetical protein